MRASDTVARLGGDEFTVVCEGVKSERDALVLAEQLATAWAEPFSIGTGEVLVTASTGVALTTERNEDAARLLRQADAAMYRSKASGRGRREFYDVAMRMRSLTRLGTENDLRRALDRAEFRVVYQPVMSLSDGRPAAVEALLRWQHPERGTVPPADFITVSEELGLIGSIGQWVLETACRQLVSWRSANPACRALRVYVNLSARQFAAPDLVGHVADTLAATALPADRLGLELTETALIDDVPEAIEKLRALKALDVCTLLDDFGTGYSSLSYLLRFPLDVLKIDRSFVQALEQTPQPAAIVNAIVELASALGMSVVAEGVEHEAQLREVHRLGCDLAQGYHVARPLSPPRAMQWIAARTAAGWPSPMDMDMDMDHPERPTLAGPQDGPAARR